MYWNLRALRGHGDVFVQEMQFSLAVFYNCVCFRYLGE